MQNSPRNMLTITLFEQIVVVSNIFSVDDLWQGHFHSETLIYTKVYFAKKKTRKLERITSN